MKFWNLAASVLQNTLDQSVHMTADCLLTKPFIFLKLCTYIYIYTEFNQLYMHALYHKQYIS